MQEILITLLLFGLVVLLAATRYGSSRPIRQEQNRNRIRDRATSATTIRQSPVDHQPAPQSGAVMPPSTMEPATPVATEMADPTPSLIVPPFLEPEAEVDLPLAASLPLQESIQPETTAGLPDLIPEMATIIEATTETATVNDRDQQNVLEEIAHLGTGEQETTIADLARHAHHANPMVRAAVAVTLGDRAAKNQGSLQTEWVAVLNQLLQDSNSEVRLQAATALGKIQLPVDLT